MNSALQCLVNCEALADYFLGFDWSAEINRYILTGTDVRRHVKQGKTGAVKGVGPSVPH